MALTRLGPNNSSNISGINLTSQVTGTLPTGNGGTGATSFTAGSMKLIASHNASNESVVEITSTNSFVMDSTYKRYILDVIDYSPVSNSSLRMDYGSGSGGTTRVTTSAYRWAMKSQSSNNNDWDSYSGSNTAYIGITGEQIMSDDDHQAGFRIMIDNPSSTTVKKTVFWTGGYISSSGTYAVSLSGVGWFYNDTNAVTGLHFHAQSGNIERGSFKLYGIS
tara:strand:+ start:11 stop:673 length:663 start_codon:yes stop_codon:yes gene_type:complete